MFLSSWEFQNELKKINVYQRDWSAGREGFFSCDRISIPSVCPDTRRDCLRPEEIVSVITRAFQIIKKSSLHLKRLLHKMATSFQCSVKTWHDLSFPKHPFSSSSFHRQGKESSHTLITYISPSKLCIFNNISRKKSYNKHLQSHLSS